MWHVWLSSAEPAKPDTLNMSGSVCGVYYTKRSGFRRIYHCKIY